MELFFVGFSDLSRPLAHVCRKWSDVNKTPVLVIRKRHRHFCDISYFDEKSSKNCIFFGTSILEAFGEGFGKVLGGQKPRFSQLFRHFLEANFKRFFGGLKIRKNDQQGDEGLIFRPARRNVQGPGER